MKKDLKYWVSYWVFIWITLMVMGPIVVLMGVDRVNLINRYSIETPMWLAAWGETGGMLVYLNTSAVTTLVAVNALAPALAVFFGILFCESISKEHWPYKVFLCLFLGAVVAVILFKNWVILVNPPPLVSLIYSGLGIYNFVSLIMFGLWTKLVLFPKRD